MNSYLDFFSQPKAPSRYFSMNNFGQQVSPNTPGIEGYDPSTVPKPVSESGSKEIPFLGYIDPKTGMKQMGLADYGLGALGAGLNAFIGMKQYGLSKDQFNFQKNSWNKEYEAQKGLTNGELMTRQMTRNKDGFGENAATYMAKYGVK